MKKYISMTLLAAALAVGFSGCTSEFEEINTNPNNPEQVAPNLLLPSAIRSISNRVHGIALGTETGALWVQHMSKIQYTDEDRFIPRVTTFTTGWNFYSTSSMDLANMVSIAKATPTMAAYAPIGEILLCYNYSVLTDIYGDIPYTEALKGTSQIMAPKYDAQKDIYMDLVKRLDAANAALAKADAKTAPGTDDIMFGGDLGKWRKFSNSLRLRLLLRMSGPEAAYAKTEISKMVADPAMYPLVRTSGDNVAMSYKTFPDNNPNHENRKTRNDHRVSENFVDRLGSVGDMRLMAFAGLTAGADIVGLPNGLLPEVANAWGLTNASDMSKDYMLAESAPAVYLTAAETNFALAEAAKKGLIPGGDTEAQKYYEAGITESCLQHKAILDKRLAAVADKSNKDYHLFAAKHGIVFGTFDEEVDYLISGAYTYNPSKALEQIATQKWIALFGQGLEAWSEWRRTGYPAMDLSQGDFQNGGKTPVRLQYPDSEQSLNPTGYAEAVKRQGANTLNTPLWWMKK